MIKRTGPLLLSLALFTSSLPAYALSAPEAPADANVEEARQRFLRGAELFKEGSFDAALAEFSRAYELAPNFRLLYNLAQVQLERHDYAAALRYYRDYLAEGGAELDPERREQVEKEIAQLKSRVATLTVTSNVAGAELSIDGALVGTLPLNPVIVSSGVRRLSLRKSGYTPVDRTLTVVGGDQPRVELRLETLKEGVARSPAPGKAEPVESSSVHPGVWVGLAATGAFAGTAVVFGLLTSNADADLDTELSRFPANPRAIDDERSRLKLYAGLTDGFAGAAVLSAVVTTYFVLTGSSRDDKRHAVRNDQPRTRVVTIGKGIGLERQF
jgi:tetratricopeptide (TPR) repeat protein